MKALLKENIVLVTGIALPLLLTLVFFISTQIGNATIDNPKHKLIYATNYSIYKNNGYKFTVKDNNLHFKYKPPNKDNEYYNSTPPLLYIYDPISNKSTEIELPEIKSDDEKMDVILHDPALNFTKISSKQESPDGYVFKQNYDSNGNIMTEVFGGNNSSRYQNYLYKRPKKIKIPKANSYNTKFIGWGINE